MNRKESGNKGEEEVCKLISCPNCSGQLHLLAKNNPLYDIACMGCVFRAQVKTSSEFSDEKNIVLGAGWEVMDKSLKGGAIIPPLILNLKNEIRFYPYIKRSSLIMRIAHIKSKNRGDYKMFNYDLTGLHYYVLYRKLNDN